MEGALEIVREVLRPVQETTGDLWNSLIGDRISAYRARNAMSIQKKLHDEAARLGLRLNSDKIPNRYAFTWFEEATKQDEQELQTLFARLLARAAAADRENQPDRRLVTVLSSFTPDDAMVFELLYDPKPRAPSEYAIDLTRRSEDDPWRRTWLENELTGHFGSTHAETLDHLASLACISIAPRIAPTAVQLRRLVNLTSPRVDATVDISAAIRDGTQMATFVSATALGRSLYTETALGEPLSPAARPT